MPFWNKKTDARLIVGLGNPGKKYAGNRHNIGFMCLDYFTKEHGFVFSHSRGQAKIAEGRFDDHDVILAKPQTFMNNSGESVGSLVRKYKVKPENLIVIHDDLDLPVGRIRIRSGGSSGGHKGINSIVTHISSQDFVRVRIGIGRPDRGANPKTSEDEVIDHVLGDFAVDEKEIMDKVIPCVCEVLQSLLKDGLTVTMNKYNSTDFRKK